MIADVDETLRSLLAAELGRVPGCPVFQSEQIGFDAPARVEAIQDQAARVNLYLHDVRENLELRDESFRHSRGATAGESGKRRAPVRLDLSYLITVYIGDDARAEHRLLSQVLGVLMRCLAVPTPHLCGVLQGVGANGVSLATIQPDQAAFRDPPALWQALGGQLRPALGLKVTAPFDPFETQWTRVVRQARFGLQPAPSAPSASANGATNLAPTVAGIVLDGADEKPLEGVTVQVLADASAPRSVEETHTDARGLFALNLSPGTHRLEFSRAGYDQAQSEVVVPTQRGEVAEPVVIALRAVAPETLAAQHAARMESLWQNTAKPTASNEVVGAQTVPTKVATSQSKGKRGR